MTQFKKFLSIALLASCLATGAAFANEEDKSFGHKVAEKVNCALNAVDYVNPFAYGLKAQELDEQGTETQAAGFQVNHPTLSRTVKYAVVVALVASNPTVTTAVASLVSTVKGLCGVQEDDVDDEEPTRLTLGSQA